MHAVERAGDKCTRRGFIEDLFCDCSTLKGTWVGWTDHPDFGAMDCEVFGHSWGEARVDDVGVWFGEGGFVDMCVDCFSSFHEAVAEMGVLIEGICVACEGEDVFVIAGSEFRCWHGGDGFKDDLG